MESISGIKYVCIYITWKILYTKHPQRHLIYQSIIKTIVDTYGGVLGTHAVFSTNHYVDIIALCTHIKNYKDYATYSIIALCRHNSCMST